MKEEKARLRKIIRNKLMEMDRIVYEKRSHLIHNRLYSTDIWHEAEIIGITLSMFPEVDTFAIIEEGWRKGKTIAVPKCVPATRELQFFRIQNLNEVEKGYFGLLEPNEERTEAIEREKIDLLIVPGIVFSTTGYRIGHGGGYYDRYLQNFDQQTVSLVFEEQIVDQLPVEMHDERVEMIVTERDVIDCRNG
ncbi:5-formyltetrahydrofolate cyclo-ligase [Fervidibacillus albus]|uniref:5-formyltetrahydrofolate cyclo-ligase n=1 Tax=Fervidibacillus albus TaxID=2980026 RepID=A0A9E8LVM6_9BACI|nr:5-formyltetrahydrofolate cyclo-ligase [Fervidibacillus albus]WAA10414.1 5-formyltetrahydrofolate cyclo-ligase [Fervidibacillus albus]